MKFTKLIGAKKRSLRAAIKHFEAAVRLDEMKGSYRVREQLEIEREYKKTKDKLCSIITNL